ncbi:hypothetical protein BKA62DRAFT_785667 [Auriculariales sp. MPI-PUGE-AT-0066]|nr:hypothetical protein BKA62DRAFT_785667 [Auriculariales sp. MPI-PUGE-AT-0066]
MRSAGPSPNKRVEDWVVAQRGKDGQPVTPVKTQTRHPSSSAIKQAATVQATVVPFKIPVTETPILTSLTCHRGCTRPSVADFTCENCKVTFSLSKIHCWVLINFRSNGDGHCAPSVAPTPGRVSQLVETEATKPVPIGGRAMHLSHDESSACFRSITWKCGFCQEMFDACPYCVGDLPNRVPPHGLSSSAMLSKPLAISSQTATCTTETFSGTYYFQSDAKIANVSTRYEILQTFYTCGMGKRK